MAQLPLTWIDVDKVPIQFVNNVLGQVDDFGDIILAFGQTTPPALTGTDEEMRRQVERIAYVPVRPVARFSMSRDRLEQMIGFLGATLKMHDDAVALRRRLNKGDPK
jgi:hypothetical protein